LWYLAWSCRATCVGWCDASKTPPYWLVCKRGACIKRSVVPVIERKLLFGLLFQLARVFGIKMITQVCFPVPKEGRLATRVLVPPRNLISASRLVQFQCGMERGGKFVWSDIFRVFCTFVLVLTAYLHFPTTFIVIGCRFASLINYPGTAEIQWSTRKILDYHRLLKYKVSSH